MSTEEFREAVLDWIEFLIFSTHTFVLLIWFLTFGWLNEWANEQLESCEFEWIFDTIKTKVIGLIKAIDGIADGPFGSVIYSGIIILEAVDDVRRKPSGAPHL